MPETDKKKLDVKKQFKLDWDAQMEFLQEMDRDFEFYTGGEGQWDEADRQKLTAEGRPIISFNLIMSKVNAVDGYQRNNKYDARYMPVEENDVSTAVVMNQLSKHVDYQNNYDYSEAEAFRNALIGGLWWFSFDIDYSNDPIDGEVKISIESPRRIIPDKNAESYDKQDGNHIWVINWIDKEEALARWPKKKEAIERAVESYKPESVEKTRDINEGDLYKDPKYIPYNDKSGLVRIDEYYYKEYEQRELFIDAANRSVIDLDTIDEDLRKDFETALRTRRDIRIISHLITKIRVKSFFGEEELSDEPTKFTKGKLAQSFPMVPLYAYRLFWKDQEFVMGMARNLRDPQKETNKRHAQIIEIVGTMAKSGWLREKGAIDPENVRVLKEQSSKPGVDIELNPGGLGKIKQIEAPNFPHGLLRLEEMGVQYVDRISGVIDFPSDKVEPGIALQVKERQAVMIIASLFDNLKLTKRLIGQFKLDAIQQVYEGVEKAIRVTGITPEAAKFVTINQKVYDESGQETGVINNVSLGKYDIMTLEAPASPTYRLMMFSTFIDLAKVYPHPIVLELAFRYADLPEEEKKQILDTFRANPMLPQGMNPSGANMPAMGG